MERGLSILCISGLCRFHKMTLSYRFCSPSLKTIFTKQDYMFYVQFKYSRKMTCIFIQKLKDRYWYTLSDLSTILTSLPIKGCARLSVSKSPDNSSEVTDLYLNASSQGSGNALKTFKNWNAPLSLRVSTRRFWHCDSNVVRFSS